MMKETNKHILIEAIHQLPQYEPKDSVWDAIDMDLTVEENELGLKKTIVQLPDYNPPSGVWENIEKGLDEDQASPARIFSIRKWAAAAAVFMAVSVGAWMFSTGNSNTESVAVTYSEEKVPASFLNIDWEADEDAFALVADICKKDKVICRQPDFKIMTDELDELNAAKDELKAAMNNYGNDPDLIAQLTAIEHERTDLLKKIIKRI